MIENPIYSGTVASRVTERLRADIITKRIDAGSRITIKEISERYGTSNMPVREAFRTLEGEKLLEVNAYKGATVLPIDERFIRETYGLLRALEDLIYETAVPYLDCEVFEQLELINEDIGRVAKGEALGTAYMDLNTAFHDLIMSKGGNSKAIELYKYYHMLIRLLRKNYQPSKDRIASVYDEHTKLLLALKAKDVPKLKLAVDTHVLNAMNNFLKVYLKDE